MSIKSNQKFTFAACFIGYITQALILTLPSLLFTSFYSEFQISLKELGGIIIICFLIQILMDLISAPIVVKTGYRIPGMIAHLTCFLGLISLSFLPFIMENKLIAISLPIFLQSVGGGLIEVIISPVMEGLDTKEKSASMSLLHSFFCWGQLATALFATLFFFLFGIENWRWLPLILSIVPFSNIILFSFCHLPSPCPEGKLMSVKELFSSKLFIMFLILMLCAGAAEQSMSQWASLFAEKGLNVSKSTGDLLGICLFALLMGISRIFYGFFAEKINLLKFTFISSALCIISYLITIFAPIPYISLFGCALCGLSVGIMWPGVLSLSSAKYPLGGSTMFGLLAFFGDIGCSLGPGMVGFLSDFYNNLNFSSNVSSGLKFGLLFAIIFPLIMFLTILFMKKREVN